jgi:hypothetical protein
MLISDEYIAGFFDGEGCINITVVGAAKQVALRVYITNSNKEVLTAIKDKYGGTISAIQHKINWKISYLLTFHGIIAEKFLRAIGLSLIVKREQVKLAFEFLDYMKRKDRLKVIYKEIRYNKFRAVKVRKPETILKELEYKERMHELNRKGVTCQ